MNDELIDRLTVIWFRTVYGDAARVSQAQLAKLGPARPAGNAVTEDGTTIDVLAVMQEAVRPMAAVFSALTTYEPGMEFPSPEIAGVWTFFRSDIEAAVGLVGESKFGSLKLDRRRGQEKAVKVLMANGVAPILPSRLFELINGSDEEADGDPK